MNKKQFLIKIITLIIFLAQTNLLLAQKKMPPIKYYTVEGYLTHTSQYCGGIAPSREEESELHTPKPYYTKLYLRKGTKNSTKKPLIDSAVTDNKGRFEFTVPAGDYVIIMPYQKDKKILTTLRKMKSKEMRVNDLCLNGWWNGGLFKISVRDSSIKDMNYNFHNRCFVPYPFPCIDYNGPMPP